MPEPRICVHLCPSIGFSQLGLGFGSAMIRAIREKCLGRSSDLKTLRRIQPSPRMARIAADKGCSIAGSSDCPRLDSCAKIGPKTDRFSFQSFFTGTTRGQSEVQTTASL